MILLLSAQLFKLAELAEAQEDLLSGWQYELLVSNDVVLASVMGELLVGC